MNTRMITLFGIFLLILPIITGTLAHAMPLEGRAYLVTMHYKNGGIRNATAILVDAESPTQSFVQGPSFKITVKSKGVTLFNRTFVIPSKLEIIPRPGDDFGPYAPLDDSYHTELIPYYTEATEILISDPTGKLIPTTLKGKPGMINLTPFVLCNQNGICDDREFEQICPQDCTAGQEGPVKKFIDGNPITPKEREEWNLPLDLNDGSQTPKSETNTTQEKDNSGFKILNTGLAWWKIFIGVLILLLFLAWEKKKSRTNSTDNDDKNSKKKTSR